MSVQDQPRKLELSLVQVVASTAAAVSAAVLCSFFGVAGTIAGTAVASIVATTGTALYRYSAEVTRARLRRLHLPDAERPRVSEVWATMRRVSGEAFARLPWRVVALGTAAVLALSFAALTGVEALTGKPVSATVRGQDAKGTTLGGSHDDKPAPAPTGSPTPGATSGSSPSDSPSAGATSATPEASDSATPTPAETPSDAATPGEATTPTVAPVPTPS